MRKAEHHNSVTAPRWVGGLAREDLEGLLGAVNRLSGLADPSVVAANAAREARILAGVDLVGVAAAESDGSLAMIGSAGAASDWFVRLRFHVDPGEGFAGMALATRLPLVFDTNDEGQRIFAYDARDGASTNVVLGPPYSAHLRERIAPEELREFIGVPIDFNGQALGLLYAGNRNGKPASPRSRMLLARFAAMIGPLLSAAGRARQAAVAELARERERIAFSLHDTIGQILFGIGSSAKRAQYLLPEEAADCRRELRRIELEAARAAAHLREVVPMLASVPPNSHALKAGEIALYREIGAQRLSDREYEVLRLLARGLNTREIALELALMPNTVRSYVQTVLGKLQSRNRVMAIATARRLRLI